MKVYGRFSLLLPLALFCVAIFLDLNITSGSMANAVTAPIRELLVAIALLLSLPLIYLQKWASDRNVLRGIRSLFFLIFFTYLLLLLSQNRLSLIRKALEGDLAFSDNLSFYVLLVSWSFFISVFMLIILGTLKNLIFIKQKKSTARNFSLLLFLLVAYPVVVQGQLYYEQYFNLSNNLYEWLGYTLLFQLILLIVINSFRVSWINYLNKKQKLACFWGALLLLPAIIHFRTLYHDLNPAQLFSPILGEFVDMGLVFLSVYLSFAFFSLLAHLPTAQLYDRKINQINSLHNLSRALSSEFDLDKLVVTTVRLAAEVTEADFAWLELVDPKTKRLRLASSTNLSVSEQRRLEQSFTNPLQEYLKNVGEPFLSNQVLRHHLAKGVKTWNRQINSLLAVPLTTNDGVIGFLYAGQKLEFGFEQDDIEMLRAFSRQVVIAVENARLVRESIIKERLEQELKVAHDAQMKLLPKEMPRLKGLAVEADCVTANEVGGDYYDFFTLGENKLGVVIGDVSGKGASAAFYMAEIKGIIGALARIKRSPRQVLIETNQTLYETTDRRIFITAIYGIFDLDKSTFTFCRAGHCPVIYTDETTPDGITLEPKGLGLGLVTGKIFEDNLEQVTAKIGNNGCILLYTDGVNEARNTSNEEFGEKRLQESFVSCRHHRPEKIKESLLQEINSFVGGKRMHDDYSFVILKKTT